MTDDSRRTGRAYPPVRKSLGQHFLTDRRILGRIADALELRGDETVLEIGPGRGALTDLLAPRAGRLVAIEYDRALAVLLRERYASSPNVIVAEADVLSVSLGELAQGPYVLVGNVPYYITTPILFHALVPPRADRAVYLVQKEVADRLAAHPGTKEYGALTVNVAALARAETVFRVPAGAFSPPPKVESAVVRITPHENALVAPEEERAFRHSSRARSACDASRCVASSGHCMRSAQTKPMPCCNAPASIPRFVRRHSRPTCSRRCCAPAIKRPDSSTRR